MTTPSEFGAQGDDTVAARISVDLPDEALSRLQQLAQQTGDLRTNMQATVRASADYADYLRQLPQLLRDAAAANEQFLGAAGGAMASSRSDVAAPGGRGRYDAQSTSTLWSQNDRSDADRQLAQLRERNPRQYANLAAQQAIDEAGRRPVDERVILDEGRDEDVLAPPVPRRRPRTPGDGDRRPPNRGRDGGGGGGTGGPGPANRNTPGQGGGEGPRGPRPQQDDNDFDWLEYAQRFQRGTSSFLGNVYRETAQGGRSSVLDIAQLSIGGVAGVTQRFQSQQQQRAAQAQAEADAMLQRSLDPNDPTTAAEAAQAADVAARLSGRATALGGAASIGLRAAGVAGVAVGAGYAVQQGGQWYQQHAAQGMQRGGGFSEGMAFEAQVRTMAMNPFISLEQSRKIMQSALSEGYTGKEFDTVTQFMAENLQKMNVDVATSVRALREQVQTGGQSLESVQTDIMTAQQLAANPEAMRTAGEFVESYQRGTEKGVQQGIEGQEAGEYGLVTSAALSNIPGLSDTVSEQLQNAAFSSPGVQGYIHDKLGLEGPLSGTMAEALSRPEGAQEALKAQFAQWEEYGQVYIQQLANATNEGQRREAVLGFQSTLASLGYQFSESDARKILETMMGEGGLNGAADRASQEVRTASTGGPARDVSEGERAGHAAQAWGNIAQGAAGAAVAGAGNLLGFLPFGNDIREYGERVMGESRQEMAEDLALQNAEGMNDRISALISDKSTYAGDIKVRSAEGQEMSLLDATRNKAVIDQLVSGNAQIAMPGGEFGKLEDLSAAQAASGAGGRTQTTLVDLTDRAAEYLRIANPTGDPRNQNQRSADSGEDGASRNDPPAGLPPG